MSDDEFDRQAPTDPSQIVVGSIVRAAFTVRDDLRNTGPVKGELGVCLAVLPRPHGQQTRIVLFHSGPLMTFTLEGVERHLWPEGRVVEGLTSYQLNLEDEYQSVMKQWSQGYFNEAWTFRAPRLVASNPEKRSTASADTKTTPNGAA